MMMIGPGRPEATGGFALDPCGSFARGDLPTHSPGASTETTDSKCVDLGLAPEEITRMHHRLPFRGPLDLDLTLTCGQAFRWRRSGRGWSGVVGRAEFLLLGAGPETLEVETVGEDPGAEAIRRYFRLDEDPRIHLEHAPELEHLPGFAPLLGMRLLRQDSWEALASFICSAAANIRKITTCVEALSDRFGEPIRGSDRRGFPTVRALASARESDLRRAGLGFRAPYLLGTARMLAMDGAWSWERVRGLELDGARAELTRFPGVGPKIADCALLFGLDRLDAYPVDRWIRRATQELSSRRSAGDDELARWAVRLGPGRGYLQQILFHLRRTTGRPLPPLASWNPARRPARKAAAAGGVARARAARRAG